MIYGKIFVHCKHCGLFCQILRLKLFLCCLRLNSISQPFFSEGPLSFKKIRRTPWKVIIVSMNRPRSLIQVVFQRFHFFNVGTLIGAS